MPPDGGRFFDPGSVFSLSDMKAANDPGSVLVRPWRTELPSLSPVSMSLGSSGAVLSFGTVPVDYSDK